MENDPLITDFPHIFFVDGGITKTAFNLCLSQALTCQCSFRSVSQGFHYQNKIDTNRLGRRVGTTSFLFCLMVGLKVWIESKAGKTSYSSIISVM